MTSFTIIQFTNQTNDIFYLKIPIFKIPRLLTIGDPVKTSSLWAWLLTSSHSFVFKTQIFQSKLDQLDFFWNPQDEQISKLSLELYLEKHLKEILGFFTGKCAVCHLSIWEDIFIFYLLDYYLVMVMVKNCTQTVLESTFSILMKLYFKKSFRYFMFMALVYTYRKKQQLSFTVPKCQTWQKR